MNLILIAFALIFWTAQASSNEELRETHRILIQKLRVISQDNKSVQEDYDYNKQKLFAFINQYSETSEIDIKYAMLEGIHYYCESILSNFEVLGDLEGISSSSLKSLTSKLSYHIHKHKLFTLSKDLADKYNQLQEQISIKELAIHNLQQENSSLLGKIATTLAQKDELLMKISQTQERIDKANYELENMKELHKDHVEIIKISLQNLSIDSIEKEKENLDDIQKSQDMVIGSLQRQAEELALRIEQISVENSGINAKIDMFENTIGRFERDLRAKDAQLINSENKYEEFRFSVEENTELEISSLQELENMYMEEINKFDKESVSLFDELELCKSNSEISRLKNRQNNNKINELTSELDDTNTRVEISKASKQIEIDNLQQKVESSSQAKKNLENQLKEAEKHIKELNRQISDINIQIADAEYSTKRKKSLFSF